MANINWTLTWNTVAAISTALMAVTIIFTVIFAVKQLLSMKGTRCSDLLMELDQTWNSKEYIRSRKMIHDYSHSSNSEEAPQSLKEALKTFEETNAEEFFIMIRIANFFENLGFLGRKKYLDRKDALELFGDTAQNYWNLFSAFVSYQREEREEKQPRAWVYFEDLASRFTKVPDTKKDT